MAIIWLATGIYQVSWRLRLGPALAEYIDVISVVLEEWGAFVATIKALNPPQLARKANPPVLLCSCWLFVQCLFIYVLTSRLGIATLGMMSTMVVSGWRESHDLAF